MRTDRIVWIESQDGQIAVTDMSMDDLFIWIQPDEKSKQEARDWIAREKADKPISLP